MTPTINPQGFYESREAWEEAMAAKRQEREEERERLLAELNEPLEHIDE